MDLERAAVLACAGQRGHRIGRGAQTHIEDAQRTLGALAESRCEPRLLDVEAVRFAPGTAGGMHHLAMPEVAHGPRAAAQRYKLEVAIAHGFVPFTVRAKAGCSSRYKASKVLLKMACRMRFISV